MITPACFLNLETSCFPQRILHCLSLGKKCLCATIMKFIELKNSPAMGLLLYTQFSQGTKNKNKKIKTHNEPYTQKLQQSTKVMDLFKSQFSIKNYIYTKHWQFFSRQSSFFFSLILPLFLSQVHHFLSIPKHCFPHKFFRQMLLFILGYSIFVLDRTTFCTTTAQ